MATAPKSTEPPAIHVGDVVLDRYRVVEQIASGGHSVVFRGQDVRLSRPVCIKVFSGLGGKSGVGRTSYEHFVQEAFALSQLTHPNTLRIYDFGHLGASDEEGMPLQVCEYMNGGTLSNVIREQGRQSLAETARVIGAMCAALGEAHALGIVHRDIKPQNILFGAVGVTRLPKLADFGIAKWRADELAPEGKRAEDTAIVAGQKLAMYSPSWAAPEQLAGQPVSAATDIYSIAVVAVYMLSGKAIFADEDVYAGYKKRRHADNLIRDALAPHVPRRVIALLTRALAFDPKLRLASVEDLAHELSTASDAGNDEPKISISTEPTVPSGLAYHLAKPSALASGPPTMPGLSPVVVPPAPVRSDPASGPPAPPAGHPQQNPQDAPAHSAPAHGAPAQGAPAQGVPGAPAIKIWQEPIVRPPWMGAYAAATGTVRWLPLTEVAQTIGDRNVQFVFAPENTVDLVGTQAQKVRITFLNAHGGVRVIHVKGMTCFVSHLGGRPSPAVQLDQPSDISLVTPRAQEIGHIRVANGVTESGQIVFSIGNERVAIMPDDCTDPILFDFGPGSDAYFVYTRGRTIPKVKRR